MSGTSKKSVSKRSAAPKSAKSASVRAATTKRAATKTKVVKPKSTTAKPKKIKVTATKTAIKTASPKVVHTIPEIHAPAAPRVKASPSYKINEAWIWVAYFLTFLFVYSVTETVLRGKDGVVGSPNSYAGIPALALALVVWRSNRTKSTYTGMVIIVSMLATSAFIWLFGVTGASSLLFGS